jgi:hypothetical protein
LWTGCACPAELKLDWAYNAGFSTLPHPLVRHGWGRQAQGCQDGPASWRVDAIGAAFAEDARACKKLLQRTGGICGETHKEF